MSSTVINQARRKAGEPFYTQAGTRTIRLLMQSAFALGYDPRNSLDTWRQYAGNVCLWRGAR